MINSLLEDVLPPSKLSTIRGFAVSRYAGGWVCDLDFAILQDVSKQRECKVSACGRNWPIAVFRAWRKAVAVGKGNQVDGAEINEA